MAARVADIEAIFADCRTRLPGFAAEIRIQVEREPVQGRGPRGTLGGRPQGQHANARTPAPGGRFECVGRRRTHAGSGHPDDPVRTNRKQLPRARRVGLTHLLRAGRRDRDRDNDGLLRLRPGNPGSYRKPGLRSRSKRRQRARNIAESSPRSRPLGCHAIEVPIAAVTDRQMPRVTSIGPLPSEDSTVGSGRRLEIGSKKGLGGEDGSSYVRSMALPALLDVARAFRYAAALTPIRRQARIREQGLDLASPQRITTDRPPIGSPHGHDLDPPFSGLRTPQAGIVVVGRAPIASRPARSMVNRRTDHGRPSGRTSSPISGSQFRLAQPGRVRVREEVPAGHHDPGGFRGLRSEPLFPRGRLAAMTQPRIAMPTATSTSHKTSGPWPKPT